eukprot:CCRYP_009346-RB/>CCRYP_009346-RB protein AED:0.43 eAED:0.43 QI:72/1/1/1/0/0/2/1/402
MANASSSIHPPKSHHCHTHLGSTNRLLPSPSLTHPTRQTRTSSVNIDIQLHRSQSMTSPSSCTTNTAINHYKIRPYNPHTDRIALEEICATVYNGKDYLPQMAESYAADPLCSFLALTAPPPADAAAANGDEDKDTILAVANYKRLPSQKCAWIEAVRTHPLHRNRGLASLLLRELMNLSTVVEHSATNDDGTLEHPTTTTLLTCTIQSNVGMQRALEKVGFTRYRTIPALSLEMLKQLPGWSSHSRDNTITDAPRPPPQPLLTALHLHHLISPEAKKLASSSSRWRTITNDNELLFALNACRHHGNTSGYLPGLYEYIVPTPSRKDIQESMKHGLVMTLHPCENPHDDDDDNAIVTRDSRDMAILALIQDERISTLQSKWVTLGACQIFFYSVLKQRHKHI